MNSRHESSPEDILGGGYVCDCWCNAILYNGEKCPWCNHKHQVWKARLVVSLP